MGHFVMGRTSMRRTTLAGGLVGLAALVLSGCMGPTYGTGKPAAEQLFEDVSTSVAMTPRRSEPIAYNPRPELVRPASTMVLPTPQEPATRAENASWPESPEERLARIRGEATANQDNPFYRSPVNTGASGTTEVASNVNPNMDPDFALTPTVQQRAEFQRRAATRQGSPTTRRYLSEPPLEYRVPTETAPAGELGEDEWRKERAIQRASGSRRGWRDFVPWL
jgi:hypothetical protein